MNYKPVGSLQETVVSGAEFSPDSAFRFMTLIEQKKEAERRLQEAREDAFFDDGFAMDVTFDDIDTSDLILTEGQLDEVESINTGSWKTIIEDCYCYRESREPDEPLNRIQSVSKNIELPSIDTYSLTFDADNIEVLNTGGEEIVEIFIDSDNSLTLYLDSDNMEFYQGMYDPPVTQEISTVERFKDSFDNLTIRNNSEMGMKVMESCKPETVKREMATTEVIFGNDIDNFTYLPDKQVQEMNENDPIKGDVEMLRSLSPLPSSETKKALLDTLEQGYLISEMTLKLFNLITGREDRIAVSYSYLASPDYLEEIARLTGSNLVSVPQEEIIIFTDEEPPKWIQAFDESFPDTNTLSDEESERLYSYIGSPSFIDMSNTWQDGLKAKEILLELFNEQEIPRDYIVSYYLVPWDFINPTRDDVMNAIEYGEKLRSSIKDVDESYGSNVYDSTLVWEQRKIYRRSEFPN